jgi:hypothetical protein
MNRSTSRARYVRGNAVASTSASILKPQLLTSSVISYAEKRESSGSQSTRSASAAVRTASNSSFSRSLIFALPFTRMKKLGCTYLGCTARTNSSKLTRLCRYGRRASSQSNHSCDVNIALIVPVPPPPPRTDSCASPERLHGRSRRPQGVENRACDRRRRRPFFLPRSRLNWHQRSLLLAIGQNYPTY